MTTMTENENELTLHAAVFVRRITEMTKSLGHLEEGDPVEVVTGKCPRGKYKAFRVQRSESVGLRFHVFDAINGEIHEIVHPEDVRIDIREKLKRRCAKFCRDIQINGTRDNAVWQFLYSGHDINSQKQLDTLDNRQDWLVFCDWLEEGNWDFRTSAWQNNYFSEMAPALRQLVMSW
jgi:hypothetical protein